VVQGQGADEARPQERTVFRTRLYVVPLPIVLPRRLLFAVQSRSRSGAAPVLQQRTLDSSVTKKMEDSETDTVGLSDTILSSRQFQWNYCFWAGREGHSTTKAHVRGGIEKQ